ncbi:M48 family peptidase [Patescibacteria group bacterium]|nr:MAG: M48 family peptidase [Patescibacteria group bacterium]
MEQKLKYQLKKSRRVRRMRLAVYCDGSVVATAPQHLADSFIENWIQQKADWILNKLRNFERKGFRAIPKYSRKEYLQYKKQALLLAKSRLDYFSGIYNLQYQRISIRNQKTRWGSCSRHGNLSFNYKIATLEPHLADYIVVHELCHLREFNHSKNFWSLVAETIPDYKDIRRQIRNL